MNRSSIFSLIILVALAGLVGDIGLLHRSAPGVASAEEKGIHVDLGYLHGYSTTGPTDVYGVSVIWPSEGVAMLSVHVMPRLLGGEQYVWWALNTNSGAAIKLGAFNTTETGEGYVDAYLQHPLPVGTNAVLVTVAPHGDAMKAPGPARTLGGYFPPLTSTAAQIGQRAPGTSASPGAVTPGSSSVVVRGTPGNTSLPDRSGSTSQPGRSRTAGTVPWHSGQPILPVELPRTGGWAQ